LPGKKSANLERSWTSFINPNWYGRIDRFPLTDEIAFENFIFIYFILKVTSSGRY